MCRSFLQRIAPESARHPQWFLHCVGFREAWNFVEKTYGVELADGTIHNYYINAGLSSRLMRGRTAGYKVDLETLIDLFISDVQRMCDLGIKAVCPKCVQGHIKT